MNSYANYLDVSLNSADKSVSAFNDRYVVIDPVGKNSFSISRRTAERCITSAGISAARELTWDCVRNCCRENRSVGEQLTMGLATVTKVTTTFFQNGLATQTATIKVELSGIEDVFLKVPLSDIQTENTELKATLQKAGVVFVSTGAFRLWCVDTLRRLQFCPHETAHAGMFVNGDGKLDAENAKELLLSSAEAMDIDDALTKAGVEELFTILDLFSDVAVAAVNRIIGLPAYVSVYVVGDDYTAVSQLEQLYGVEAVPLLDVDFENTEKALLLVDATLASKHISETRIPKLLTLSSSVPVVLIATNAEKIPENGFVLQRFRSSSIFPINRIRSTMLALILKWPEIHKTVKTQLEKVNNFFDDLDDITRAVCTAKCIFAALLLFCSKRDDATVEMLKDRYKSYLYENFGLLGAGCILRRLRQFLSSGSVRFSERLSTAKEDIGSTVLFDRENYYFTPLAANALAEGLHISTKQFVQLLRSEGALELSDRSQKVVSVKGNEQIRAYAVKKPSIFTLGEITAGGDGFSRGFPEIMLPLGCDAAGTRGYLTLRDRFGTDNANILITGQPGSGKTFLVDSIALTAAKRGFSAVYITTTYPRYPVADAEIVVVIDEMLNETTEFSIKQFVDEAPQDFFSEDERGILELFDDVEMRFKSVVDVAEYIKNKLGDDSLVDSIVKKFDDMTKPVSCLDWREILAEGKIVYLVAEDDWNDDNTEDRLSNKLIMSLFRFKQERDQSPFLLIIDEAQDFDLGQKAPISQYVLRQGRKYGFITILASQFLSALDGRNIAKTIRLCETQIVFTPQNDSETRKKLDPHGKCRELGHILTNVPRYSFVASGHISSEEGMIDYPVVLHVSKGD